MKRIHKNDIIGEKGVAYVRQLVLDKGFLFEETGKVEAGIDAQIEIRDKVTGEVKNQIIRAQIKATENKFRSETDKQFTFYCNESDIEYWLRGNVPVILIVTRPKTREVYWKSIKDYFNDPNKKKTNKIIFNKNKDDFKKAYEELIDLSVNPNSGAYFAADRVKERLISNILSVDFSEKIYSADSKFRNHRDIFNFARTENIHLGGGWLLWNKRIWSFHDLSQSPWNKICDSNNIETYYSAEWAKSNIREIKKNFQWLLNKCLKQKLYELDILYDRDLGHFYFKNSSDNRPKKIEYHTHYDRKSSLTVFGAKPNPVNVKYYRHNAIKCQFVKYEERWFLEITPTYHFTWDGKNLDRYYENRLKTIKRIEKNRAVLSQVEMWASVLQRSFEIRASEDFIEFGELVELETNFGINESNWSDSLNEKRQIKNENLPLFKQ